MLSSKIGHPGVTGMRLLVAVLLASAAAVSAGELYRWVDEDGKVHYSDKVPPEHAARARDSLNRQGIKVDSVEAAPTPEQLEAAREKARLEAEARKEKESQRRWDRVLLNSYETVADIERARDAEIEALQRTVDMTRTAMNSHQRQLHDLVDQAADMQRAGNPVPESMESILREVREKLQEREAYIEEQRAEQASVFAEYEQDIARFRELTGVDDS